MQEAHQQVTRFASPHSAPGRLHLRHSSTLREGNPEEEPVFDQYLFHRPKNLKTRSGDPAKSSMRWFKPARRPAGQAANI